jgi:3D (Asp-Asp-Asp) domain-containing protein
MRGRIASLAVSAAGTLALAGCAAQTGAPHPSGHPVGAAKRALPARPARKVTSTHAPPPSASRCTSPPPPVRESPIRRPTWLDGVVITEYYPAPARWFVGRPIPAPGVGGSYPADWLYSARGLAMEGEGVDGHGRPVHIAALGSTGWVNAAGQPTLPVCLGKWTNGFPAWLSGGWRNAHGAVTFPLASGGWSNGPGTRILDYGGVTFQAGSSRPLRYYHSIAVDPGLIPLGSRVYIPAYRGLGGGWFLAQDTGGAIRGRHVDVYRPAPASPDDLGRYMTHQRILVLPPA